MTTGVQKSAGSHITDYDAVATTGGYSGYPTLTAGEGGPSPLIQIEDFVAVAQTAFGTAGGFVRLLRFPTRAKVKRLELYVDRSLVDGGTSSSALSLGVGVMFSDNPNDGTPAAYQNLVPTTVGIGGGSTTAGTAVLQVGTQGANPNRIFGNILANTSTGAFPNGTMGQNVTAAPTGQAAALYFGGEFTLNGTIATYGNPLTITQTPMIEIFNFLDGRGNAIEEMGYFDVFLNADVAYNTQPAGAYNIFGRLQYTVE